MRCTSKFKADGGTGVSVVFHSADKKSMAMFSVGNFEAEEFTVGAFYDFDASPQQKRSEEK